MMLPKNFAAPCLIVLTLVLAQCGSNGGGEGNTPNPEPQTGGPTPTPTATPTPTPTPTPGATEYLYVASGTGYAGLGVVMSTPIHTIAKYKLDGTFVGLVADYTLYPGDTPTAVVNFDSQNLLVAIDNASGAGRRIDKVLRDGSGALTYLLNSTAFGAAASNLRDLLRTPDGGFLISKGLASPNAAIEKFSNTKARVLMGANPYVLNPAGACATAQTNFAKMAIGPSGNIVLAHAAASPNNKILLINGAGYAVAGDCLAGVTAPSVNHVPTAVLVHSSGVLFVAFANNTGPVHEIYSYTLTSSNISAPVLVYKNLTVLQGISAMTEAADKSIFVASGASTFNSIERFSYDATLNQLVRIGTIPAVIPSIYTRSVSALVTSIE